MISATECVNNMETNETVERDPEIIAIKPHNCEGFAWLRWDISSAANAIQWTIMAERNTSKLTLWVSFNGWAMPCTLAPTTAAVVGIKYPKTFRDRIVEMKFPFLQKSQYTFMERLAKAAIKRGNKMLWAKGYFFRFEIEGNEKLWSLQNHKYFFSYKESRSRSSKGRRSTT